MRMKSRESAAYSPRYGHPSGRKRVGASDRYCVVFTRDICALRRRGTGVRLGVLAALRASWGWSKRRRSRWPSRKTPAMVGGDSGAAAMEIRVRELEEQIRAQHREQSEQLLRDLTSPAARALRFARPSDHRAVARKHAGG